MFDDISFLFESFIAVDTRERLGAGVDQHVSLQFELGAELLLADVAGHGAHVHLVTQLLVLLESLQGGVGLVTGLNWTLERHFSVVNWDVVPQVVLVVKLFTTGRTEVFVALSLLVNISEVLQQVVFQKELLLTDATGNIEASFLSAMLLLHMIVQLNSACKSFRRRMEMTNDFSVLYLGPGTVVSLQGLLVTEDVHTDRAVGELLLRVPGGKVSQQVVLLVEIQ